MPHSIPTVLIIAGYRLAIASAKGPPPDQHNKGQELIKSWWVSRATSSAKERKVPRGLNVERPIPGRSTAISLTLDWINNAYRSRPNSFTNRGSNLELGEPWKYSRGNPEGGPYRAKPSLR